MIHFDSVSELARTFGRVPEEMAAGLREELPAAGQALLRASQANASWSTRIPAAHYLRAGTGVNGGVSVGVDSVAAPHARPYEGMTVGGSRAFFRHPVFGNRDNWVQEATRPFLRPAVEAERPALEAAITALVHKVTSI
jgi:hypothetical protein